MFPALSQGRAAFPDAQGPLWKGTHQGQLDPLLGLLHILSPFILIQLFSFYVLIKYSSNR